jgi:translation elongation factor EF-Tu-like GTPase
MFTIRINSIFSIAGSGIVLAGKVESGRVRAGAKAVIRTPSKSLDTVLSRLEQNREIVSTAGAGEDVAIMIADFDPNILNDGIEVSRTEEGFPSYRAVELVIKAASKSW